MPELKTIALFVVTALAEVVGLYLPYLWLRQGKSAWLLLPAAASLALFAWLLTLQPTAAGPMYAAAARCTSLQQSSGCGRWTEFVPRLGTWWARSWHW